MTGKTWRRKKQAARGRRALEQRVVRLVRKYQGAMGLGGWDIEVTFGPTPSGVIARCNADYRIREARLTFNLDVAETRPHLLKHDVIHELAHCVNSRQKFLIDTLWGMIEKDVDEDLAVMFERMPALDKLA